MIGKQVKIIVLTKQFKLKCIEETTDFKIQKLAIVNIPKEPEKEVSMYILKIDDAYFKGFEAMTYLDQLESNFNNDVKKWKQENKKNATKK